MKEGALTNDGRIFTVWPMQVHDKTGIAQSLHAYLCPGVNAASIVAGMKGDIGCLCVVGTSA